MTDLIPRDAAIAEIEKWWKCSSTWQSPMTILRAIPTIDPAAIREAALYELAEIARGDGPLDEEAILALIGEKK